MKKIFSIMMALALCVTLLPTAAAAAPGLSVNPVSGSPAVSPVNGEWRFSSPGSYTVTGSTAAAPLWRCRRARRWP